MRPSIELGFYAGLGLSIKLMSFSLRCFAKSLNPSLYHMEHICLSAVSVMEFYRQLCSVLGIEQRGGKPGMFCPVQEQILYLYRDKKVIDTDVILASVSSQNLG